MEAIHKRVAGIDVHRMKHVVTILIEQDGAVSSQTREFGGFKRDMPALVGWLQEQRIQQVAMESTGIYWKSVFSHLEASNSHFSVLSCWSGESPDAITVCDRLGIAGPTRWAGGGSSCAGCAVAASAVSPGRDNNQGEARSPGAANDGGSGGKLGTQRRDLTEDAAGVLRKRGSAADPAKSRRSESL